MQNTTIIYTVPDIQKVIQHLETLCRLAGPDFAQVRTEARAALILLDPAGHVRLLTVPESTKPAP